MPEVRKVSGAEVAIRGMGRYRPGETYEVDRETAEYLTSRGDFALVKGDDGSGDDAETPQDTEVVDATPDTVEGAIEDGVCPWCDDYEGDAVGQHASSAHPDAWDAYKED